MGANINTLSADPLKCILQLLSNESLLKTARTCRKFQAIAETIWRDRIILCGITIPENSNPPEKVIAVLKKMLETYREETRKQMGYLRPWDNPVIFQRPENISQLFNLIKYAQNQSKSGL